MKAVAVCRSFFCWKAKSHGSRDLFPPNLAGQIARPAFCFAKTGLDGGGFFTLTIPEEMGIIKTERTKPTTVGPESKLQSNRFTGQGSGYFFLCFRNSKRNRAKDMTACSRAIRWSHVKDPIFIPPWKGKRSSHKLEDAHPFRKSCVKTQTEFR